VGNSRFLALVARALGERRQARRRGRPRTAPAADGEERGEQVELGL